MKPRVVVLGHSEHQIQAEGIVGEVAKLRLIVMLAFARTLAPIAYMHICMYAVVARMFSVSVIVRAVRHR